MSSNPQPFLHFFWNSPFVVWMPYNLAVPTCIVLMNQTVHLNIVSRIVHAWTITSLKSCYLPNFLKPPYSKKNIKDNVVQSMFSFHKILINLEKNNAIWTILSTEQFFINFHQKLVFYFCFFWKTWIWDNTGWPILSF